jgi:diguanylate cyclase (GGDEF)-like protein
VKRKRGQKPIPAPKAPIAVAVDPSVARHQRLIYGVVAGIGVLSIATVPLVPIAGLALTAGTATLAALIKKGERTARRDRERAIQVSIEEQAESFFIDRFTALPNRQHFLDQLGREIARAERYSYDMTVALVEIPRLQELQAAWGPEVVGKAVLHVAHTLRRITRTSDFVARIDQERFAVILLQCSAQQAGIFGDRVGLAVANRPLKRDQHLKMPVYVNVNVSALQFNKDRFRGPLEFLSAAGGEAVRAREQAIAGRRTSAAADARNLRRQLVADYYPDGQMQDFADAYREHRSTADRAS